MIETVWDSFKGQGKMILVATCLFILGAAVGFLYLSSDPELVISNLDRLLGNILKIGEAMEENNRVYVMWLIFENNLKALFVIMFGGVIFGIIPLFGILFNGFIVGIVMALSFYQGKSLAFFLAAVIPHGILELPAIIVGSAFGLRTGFELIFPGAYSRWERLKENTKKQALALVILIPVLLIAAGIESMITPLIARLFT